MRNFRTLAAAGLLVSACASAPRDDGQLVSDPFEGFNRRMFAFNEGADRYVIGPAAQAYKTVTPSLFREGFGNFSANLGEPVVFLNDVLQGKPARAGTSAGRFLINSTIGIVGVFDVASEFGLKRHSEDFGQTLAVWGVDSGPYLVLPLLGPSTVRDLGASVDRFADPLTWVSLQADYLANSQDFDTAFRATYASVGTLNARVKLDGALRAVREQPSPYVAMRRAYMGAREAAIRDGAPPEDPYAELPEFE